MFLLHQNKYFSDLSTVAVSNIPATPSLMSKELYALSKHRYVLGQNSIYSVISTNLRPHRLQKGQALAKQEAVDLNPGMGVFSKWERYHHTAPSELTDTQHILENMRVKIQPCRSNNIQQIFHQNTFIESFANSCIKMSCLVQGHCLGWGDTDGGPGQT